MRLSVSAGLLLVTILFTSGCAVVAVGAAGTAVLSANDRRSVGTQIDDKTTQSRVSIAISKIPALNQDSDINVDVYNSQVLLTGRAPTSALISLAGETVASVKQVSKVHNQIKLGVPIPNSASMNDIWLASKIRTQLLTDRDIPMLQINIVVENSTVYLMGMLTAREANLAIDIIRNVDGVRKVVRVLEMISEESIREN